MIIACRRQMTPANILVQPPGLKTSQIIQYSNQESQNSLTQRILPQLHCVRKLLFHETEKFIFAILKFLTPLNIASMIIACQRQMTPPNILIQSLGLKTSQIIQWIIPRIMHLFCMYLHYISFALHLHFIYISHSPQNRYICITFH